MKGLRASLLLGTILYTATAFAGLAPGPVVAKGLSGPSIGDVNGDGLADLVHDRTVLLNLGGGNFSERDLGLPGKAGLNGGDAIIATLDVNGDHRADLLTSDRPTAPPGSDAGAMTYRLYIAGNRLPYGKGITLGKGINPYIADADGNGRDDLVMSAPVFDHGQDVATEMRVMISRGDGTFAARQPFRISPRPIFEASRRIPTGDLDHDGLPDLVIRTQHDLVVLRGLGGGDFAAPSVRYLPNRYFGGWTTELADIDGDGHLDVAMAAFRMVRVFFGDGTGRLTRFASAIIPRLRDIPGKPDNDGGNNPRSLGIGQFVRQGRTEIAAGTAEGDVVILAFENGRLCEVSRFETTFADTYVHTGAFRLPGKTDLYLTGNYDTFGVRPIPRLYYVDPAAAVIATAHTGGRARAVRGTASPTLELDVKMTGNCAPDAAENWSLTREGVFGVDRRNGRLVETVFDGSTLIFRLTVPWSTIPVTGTLEAKGGGYKGTGFATTACGAGDVKFTAATR